MANKRSAGQELQAVGDDGAIYYEYAIVLDEEASVDFGEGNVPVWTALKKLRSAGLVLKKIMVKDKLFILIGCDERRLELEAERMGLIVPISVPGYDSSIVATEFVIEMKDRYCGDNESDPTKPFFRSSKRQQIIMSIINGKISAGGASLDHSRLVKSGAIQMFFPLHDTKALESLRKNWGSFSQLTHPRLILYQPLDEVRSYFGEYIALYFAWLGFYTKSLVPLSLFGMILFIIQLSQGTDNELVPVYCILLSLWSTFYLEFWKREQTLLACRWNTTDAEENEPVRFSFKGEKRINKLTGEEEVTYPEVKRKMKVAAGLPIIFTLITAVIVGTLAILALRIILSQTPSTQSYGPTVAGMLNALTIAILNNVYLNVAYYLNEWENYRTETEFEDNLITKNFIFQFINSYTSLFYIAFAKGTKPHVFGQLDECRVSCMSELATQLGSIFVSTMVVQQTLESLVPYLKVRFRSVLSSISEGDGENSTDETAQFLESQSSKEAYLNAFDDYNEMIIQFGYVTFFAAAFPLAPVFAFANNLVEIRGDAKKLCTTFRRPFYRAVEDIGTFQYVLEIFSTIAVITNCCILAFTSSIFEKRGYIQEGDTGKKIWIAVIAEHIILLLKFSIALAIPDVPEEAVEALKIASYFKDKTMKTASEVREEKERIRERARSMKENLNEEDSFVSRKDWLSKN